MSQAYSISSQELAKWGRNLAIFLIPVALLYLAFVTAAINSTGLALADFIPSAAVQGAMVLYVINGVTDFLRKFVPDNSVSAPASAGQ